ncbi:cytochrome c biogenesis protein ResB [Actinomycetospora cinnamomea]|uniref:Cytochrome c biogenesis protein n=1 Tax=Actinomycetospora cinnamomea TaxID=663609 RepID=A0A2U1FD68_9PSEU|nr:cytochrome c biogenesis protein ResB [Actinomycetospora cinnamomea]PVZ10099.1 cytochrome c biogenesis protein [Actinomycetospora cinnamomea]
MTSTLPQASAGDAGPPPPSRPGRLRRALALARNTWRGLTSMRTALILLFLLAVAALPGAVLPQRTPSPNAVDDYFGQHPTLAPVLDDLGMFDVFATPWFAAIYLLLFVSLIGCLVPRSIEHLRGIRTEPVAVPRNLARLPHHAESTSDEDPDAVVARARRRLRGWRVAVRSEPGGVRTLSAEKGALREVGNLVFHLSLVALLGGIAAGELFGYEGQVIVMADGSEFCNSGIYAYDSFRPGLQVDGTGLDPFCLTVDGFRATFRPDGQPDSFEADVRYQDTAAVQRGDGVWQEHDLAVNDPLRIDGERVYLLGHGYAPRFTVTFPDGQQRVGLVQWRPVDQATLLSEGATKIDPPGVTDEAQRRRSQLAITGLFAPTSSGGGLVTSVFPALNNPEVAVDVLRGDLGLDSGRAQSIFSVDQGMVEQGRLVRVARENLRPGEEITLDDGTRVRFDDVQNWVSLQVSHDPAQTAVLLAAIALLGGLTLSLTVRRRRFWVRAVPAGPTVPSTTDGRTVVMLGGLARTDRAGYGEEFGRLAAELAPRRTGDAGEPDTEVTGRTVPDPAVPEEVAGDVPAVADDRTAPAREARDDDGEDDDGR